MGIYDLIKKEDIESALVELYGDYTNEILSNSFKLPPSVEQLKKIEDLKSKILSGYFYTIINPCEGVQNTRVTNVSTGQGGVFMYIDACIAAGLNDADTVAQSIYVQTDNNGMQCIANVTVTKTEK